MKVLLSSWLQYSPARQQGHFIWHIGDVCGSLSRRFFACLFVCVSFRWGFVDPSEKKNNKRNGRVVSVAPISATAASTAAASRKCRHIGHRSGPMASSYWSPPVRPGRSFSAPASSFSLRPRRPFARHTQTPSEIRRRSCFLVISK